jgi:hypothetical protein
VSARPNETPVQDDAQPSRLSLTTRPLRRKSVRALRPSYSGVLHRQSAGDLTSARRVRPTASADACHASRQRACGRGAYRPRGKSDAHGAFSIALSARATTRLSPFRALDQQFSTSRRPLTVTSNEPRTSSRRRRSLLSLAVAALVLRLGSSLLLSQMWVHVMAMAPAPPIFHPRIWIAITCTLPSNLLVGGEWSQIGDWPDRPGGAGARARTIHSE